MSKPYIKDENLTEDEIKWIESFHKVMEKAPDTLLLFASESLSIYKLNDDGSRPHPYDYVYSAETSIVFDGGAGDWSS